MGIDFPLFFPFMEYQRMTRDSTQYKTNLDFMRFYGILFHRIPCGKMTTCNRRLRVLFLLFTKQKGPRRGAARKTSGECGQRFISLTGPVALCSRMMRSISLKSEEGRSPGTVFLTLDVALPNCMAFCGSPYFNRPNSTPAT